MEKTASLTNTLADRDQLIGEVITNLTQTLDTVDQRREQLGQLIIELKGWMTDLARDRTTIGASLDNVSELTVVVADLVRRSRPVVKDDIASCAGWPGCSTSRRTAPSSSRPSTGCRSR